MNKQLTMSEFESHSEVFLSDLMHADDNGTAFRKRVLMGVTICVIAVSAGYWALHSPAGVQHPVTEHAQYVSTDETAARARIEQARVELHRAIGRFHSELDANAKALASGAVLFPGTPRETPKTLAQFAPPLGGAFQP